MIRVPTGVQDYRPALYGGIAAIELGVEGVRRVALDVDPGELERRIVLAYTGAPRQSGTNNWAITKRHIDGDRHIFDCFERIRDTAAAMREALARADWDEVGRQIADRMGQPQTAGARRDDAGDRRADQPSDRSGRNGRQGVRRRRRRLPVLLRPTGGAAGGGRGADRRRRPGARLPHRDGRSSGWITWRSPGYSGRSPTSSRSRPTIHSRFARIATAPTSSPIIRISWRRSTRPACVRFPASARTSPRGSSRSPGPAMRNTTASSSPNSRRPSWICCTCRASDPRRWQPCIANSASARSTTSSWRPPTAGFATCAAWARRRKRSSSRRSRSASGTPAGICCRTPTRRRRRSSATSASGRLPPSIEPVGSLRRGCDTCGDLDILASGADASLMDAFVGYRLVERVLGARRHQVERPARAAAFRPICGWSPGESRGAALQYFTGSKAHNIALRDRAIGRGSS